MKLGEVMTLQRGHDLSADLRQPGSVPVVSSSGITGYHSEGKASAPGVVTGRYGTLGQVYYLEETYWPLNTALYVTDFKGNVPRFVAYFLEFVLRDYKSDKAAVPGIDRNVLHEMMVRCPSVSAQARISNTLLAYDELIDINRRRMALLERAATELFQEWFVRLRFPGHERTRFADGLPDGWQRVPLADLATLVMGQSPTSSNLNEDGEGLPFHQGVSHFGERFVTHRIFTTVYSRLAEPQDILCSVRAPVGRLNVTLDRVAIGRGLSAMRSVTGHQSLLFQQLRAHFYKDDLIGSGSIFASVKKNDLAGQLLLEPPLHLKSQFAQFCDPIGEQVRVLFLQNVKLRAARDLLLPRLMNGSITP